MGNVRVSYRLRAQLAAAYAFRSENEIVLKESAPALNDSMLHGTRKRKSVCGVAARLMSRAMQIIENYD